MRYLFVLLLAGCLPALPPPAHYEALPAGAAIGQPTGEADLALSVYPAAVGAYDVPIPSAPWLVLEGQGQVGPTHASLAPGVWFRTGPFDRPAWRFGARVGGLAGTGDIVGFAPFAMPYAGGSLHLQLAWAGDRGGAVAFTAGAELMGPLAPKQFSKTTVDDQGDELVVLPLPNVYGDLDLRLDAPGRSVAPSLGVGLRVSGWGYAVPTLSAGLRFR